jgi:hypothetical protein
LGRDKPWCPTGINSWSIAFLAELILFADGTGIIITSLNPMNFKSSVNKVFQDKNRWFTTNLSSLNVSKTQFIQFITKTSSLIDLNTRESKKLSALLFLQFIYTKVGVEQVHHFST